MAILSAVPGLEVTVLVNGNPLKEYDDAEFDKSNTSAREMSKYVVSVPGAEFSIRLACTKEALIHRAATLIVNMHLDGERVVRRIMMKHEIPGVVTLNDTAQLKNDKWYNKKFMFCEVQTAQQGLIHW